MKIIIRKLQIIFQFKAFKIMNKMENKFNNKVFSLSQIHFKINLIIINNLTKILIKQTTKKIKVQSLWNKI